MKKLRLLATQEQLYKQIFSLTLEKEEAQKASVAKSQFLSGMSHELRTPLNAIIGFSQYLQMDPSAPLNESQLESVDEILKAGKNLLAIINEVLDLSRLELGRIKLTLEQFQVSNIMMEVIAQAEPFAEQNNITLVFSESPDQECCVRVDVIRIKQVLLNLITNAIKYNKPQGQVRFSCQREGDWIQFDVVDTGYGISEADQKLLFIPFQRINSASTSIAEGTGIGLAIARQVMALMDGEIGFESTVGEGSHFYIRVPIGMD